MKAHELATLNEYKQENRELKLTCEGLRAKNAKLEAQQRARAIRLQVPYRATITRVIDGPATSVITETVLS